MAIKSRKSGFDGARVTAADSEAYLSQGQGAGAWDIIVILFQPFEAFLVCGMVIVMSEGQQRPGCGPNPGDSGDPVDKRIPSIPATPGANPVIEHSFG